MLAQQKALTWDVEHILRMSLVAPVGGVILLKSPVLRRGVGTSSVLPACQNKRTIFVPTSEWFNRKKLTLVLRYQYSKQTEKLELWLLLRSMVKRYGLLWTF